MGLYHLQNRQFLIDLASFLCKPRNAGELFPYGIQGSSHNDSSNLYTTHRTHIARSKLRPLPYDIMAAHAGSDKVVFVPYEFDGSVAVDFCDPICFNFNHLLSQDSFRRAFSPPLGEGVGGGVFVMPSTLHEESQGAQKSEEPAQKPKGLYRSTSFPNVGPMEYRFSKTQRSQGANRSHILFASRILRVSSTILSLSSSFLSGFSVL